MRFGGAVAATVAAGAAGGFAAWLLTRKKPRPAAPQRRSPAWPAPTVYRPEPEPEPWEEPWEEPEPWRPQEPEPEPEPGPPPAPRDDPMPELPLVLPPHSGDVQAYLCISGALEATFNAAAISLFADRIPTHVQSVLAPLFPNLALDDIDLVSGSSRLMDFLDADDWAYAAAVGNSIVFRAPFSWPDDAVYLIHELVHVDQARRAGGASGFGCEYTSSYALHTYEAHPFELEAYEFADQAVKWLDRQGLLG